VDFYFVKLSQILKQRKEERKTSQIIVDVEAAEVVGDDEQTFLFEFQKDDQFALQQKANRLPLPKLREIVNELKKYVESLAGDKVSQLSGRNPEKVTSL